MIAEGAAQVKGVPGSEDRRSLLLAAHAELRALDLEQDLRPVAFAKLLEWIDHAVSPDVPAPDTSGGDGRAQADRWGNSLIASGLDVDAAAVEEVFVERDGRLEPGVPRSSLDRAKTAATRELSTLLVVARQVGEGEEWTPVSAIRGLCEEYGVLDAGNFAATVAAMDDIFQIRGRGQGREVRLRRAGLGVARELLMKLETRMRK